MKLTASDSFPCLSRYGMMMIDDDMISFCSHVSMPVLTLSYRFHSIIRQLSEEANRELLSAMCGVRKTLLTHLNVFVRIV